jgi:putative Mn2+ efflux pump MntP
VNALDITTVVALAFGLAMDATAVSAAKGVAVPKVLPSHVAKVALWFGGSHTLVPLLGYLVGARIGPHVEAWTHWISGLLLAAIGAKMVHEARSDDDEDAPKAPGEDPFGAKVMAALAVATSIDTFAAGVTLPMWKAPLGVSLAAIGLMAATMSTIGLFAGRKLGALFGKRLEIVGGLVLVLLGVKVVAEHYLVG